jgi:hypothetical protein
MRLTGALLTPVWRPRKLQGEFGEGHKPSQIACGSAIGPPYSSSELPPHTLHASKCRENGMCARSLVNYMLSWPSPGPLGRPHEAHRRASDPRVEAPETPGRVRGGPHTLANSLSQAIIAPSESERRRTSSGGVPDICWADSEDFLKGEGGEGNK